MSSPSALISPAVFQAAMKNVRDKSFADPQANRGAKADALKWRILVALEGAVPVLLDEAGLGKLRELTDKRRWEEDPPEDDFGRGYRQAMREVAGILASGAQPMEGP